MYYQLLKLLRNREKVLLELQNVVKKANDVKVNSEYQTLLRITRANIFSLKNRWKPDDIEHLYEVYQLSNYVPIEKMSFVLYLHSKLQLEYFVDVYNSVLQNFIQHQ